MSTTIHYESGDSLTLEDALFEIEFEATAKVSHVPAKVSGPPEYCHPDESEFELLTIKITAVYNEDGDEIEKPTPGLLAELEAALRDDFDYHEESIWEQFFDERDDGYEED